MRQAVSFGDILYNDTGGVMSYFLSELNRNGVPKLLGGSGDLSAWERRREEVLSVWKTYIGCLPNPVPVKWELLDEAQEADHRRLHIRYDTVGGDRVTAYLLLPHQAGDSALKRPAILALHPTSDDGKADVASPWGRANRRYGLELAKRGYIVLAPDVITAGERIYEGYEAYRTEPFYKRNPGWTAVGKMIVDHRQAVELLSSLEVVDSERIGVIGHSLGGYNGIFLAGLDKRVRAVVSSCGFSVFTDDPDPNRWGQRDWFSHIPRITDDIRQGKVPFEFTEIAALAAPVPMFCWSGQQDLIFPNWIPIAQGMEELHRLYQAMNAQDRFVFLLGNAGHDFPEEVRQAAYRFLDRWLSHDPSR
jgi:dienelactone hydrolase